MFHSNYMGASIYRNTEPGYKLRGDKGVWCVRRPRHRR
jgi:hypothetical protein